MLSDYRKDLSVIAAFFGGNAWKQIRLKAGYQSVVDLQWIIHNYSTNARWIWDGRWPASSVAPSWLWSSHQSTSVSGIIHLKQPQIIENLNKNESPLKKSPYLLTIFVEHGIMAHNMAKPMKTLELHYLMIQFLIVTITRLTQNMNDNK